MRKMLVTFLFLLSSLSFGSDIQDIVWNDFLRHIENNDLTSFRNMSLSKIRCYDCLSNTEVEDKELSKIMNSNDDWHSLIYDKLIFIEIERFIRNDYQLLFTPSFIEILKKAETRYLERVDDNETFIEVLVTTTNPGEVAPNHEGGQTVFQFLKVDEGYRFYGITSIP